MQEDRIEAAPPGDGASDDGLAAGDGTRIVRVPIAQPTGDQAATPGGGDRLIAALAAVIRDAMESDAAAGRDLPLSGEEEED